MIGIYCPSQLLFLLTSDTPPFTSLFKSLKSKSTDEEAETHNDGVT
jgi:hypothetical protein